MSGECAKCGEHALECHCIEKEEKLFPEIAGWINVKKNLPKIGECCLLYQSYPPHTAFNCLATPLKRQFCLIGGLRWDGKFCSHTEQHLEIKHISHWMPLPEPPEDE